MGERPWRAMRVSVQDEETIHLSPVRLSDGPPPAGTIWIERGQNGGPATLWVGNQRLRPVDPEEEQAIKDRTRAAVEQAPEDKYGASLRAMAQEIAGGSETALAMLANHLALAAAGVYYRPNAEQEERAAEVLERRQAMAWEWEEKEAYHLEMQQRETEAKEQKLRQLRWTRESLAHAG